jgi:ABC-type hemin transport system substrate-binding protein
MSHNIPNMNLDRPSSSNELKEKLDQLSDWVGKGKEDEKLYFSSRRELSHALLRLVGQIRSVTTPEAVERFIDQGGVD